MKIIHITDFHLKNEELNIQHSRILKALLKDLINYIDNNTILLFTGDFTNMGGKDFSNPSQAFTVFKEIIFDKILSKFPMLTNRIFFVPGNHDLDRRSITIKDKYIKTALLNDTSSRTIFYEDLQNGIPAFKTYQEFKETFYSHYPNKIITQLEDTFQIEIENENIGITCINSSWLCYENDDDGNILILEDQLMNSLNLIDNCNIKIALLHHPLTFLHKSESLKIKEILEKEYDLVFIGHTHKQESEFNQTLNGNCYFSVGKSLNSEDTESIPYTNGYSILEYIPNKKLLVNLRKYNTKAEKFLPNSDFGSEIGVQEININKNLSNEDATELHISDSFRIYLEDIGANLRHKNKSKIKLNEIYVYPNLENYGYSSEEDRNLTINSEKLLDEINEIETTRIIISGENSSGKTGLCKKAFEKILQRESLYPIFIKGEDIKSTDLKDLEKLKNNTQNEQYKSSKIPPIKNPFFIIDNLNDSKLSPIYLKKFLSNLIENNSSFIITWEQLFTFNEIFDSVIAKLKIYEILPLGRKYRFQLIEKWIDFDQYTNNQQRISNLYEAEKLIDSIVGKNLVPAYPLYILTILQATELFPTQNFEHSTLGHYYDVLIKSALGKVLTKNGDIEKYYTYLAELSNKMYENDNKFLVESDFIDFHKIHVKEYGLSQNGFIEIERNLINTDIITLHKETYKFKYDYIYYYFLGKYLSDNIEDPDIQDKVIKLANTLDNTDNANTYLFLAHHSKSEFVINTISEIAKNIFKDEKIVNFSEDIKEINELANTASEVITLNISKSYSEHKMDELEHLDEIDNDYDSFNSKDASNIIDYISEINKSFKTIEILGLILKNRYASIKSQPKLDIAQETYFLGLRATSSIFKTFSGSEEFIKDEIINLIIKDKSLSKSEKEGLAKKVIFNMYYMTAYSVIKRISNSLATKDLAVTFEEIRNKHKDNNAINLIDISNKLEYSTNFPFEDIDRLKSQFKNNQFPFYLLKRLSLNYLRMFPMKEIEMQKVCSQLEIPMNTQRQIAMQNFNGKHKN
ncbi:metallophosphoesterase [Chryseobacterium sp. S-02]|uniref:metallophosphoesterase n=1 Tax=Chryseobacterium sp. S-02 TaxID=3404064 RepID=UPI003CF983DD